MRSDEREELEALDDDVSYILMMAWVGPNQIVDEACLWSWTSIDRSGVLGVVNSRYCWAKWFLMRWS